MFACSRRLGKDARQWRSFAGCSTKPSGAFASTRWRSFSGRRSITLGCSNTPAREATSRRISSVVSGTLRSPWKWEELIVESAVVGGRTRAEGKARWRRRLDGLAADFRYRIEELEGEEPDSPRMARYERDLRNLGHLRGFALPIIDEL